MVDLRERAVRAAKVLEVAVEHGEDVVADEAHFVRLIDYFRLYYGRSGPNVAFSREFAASGGTKALKELMGCQSEPAAASAVTICGLVMLTCKEGFCLVKDGGLLDSIAQSMSRSRMEHSCVLHEALQQLFCSIFTRNIHLSNPEASSWALSEAAAKDFVVESVSSPNGNVRMWSTRTVAYLLSSGMLSPADTKSLWEMMSRGLRSDCSDEVILGSLETIVALLKEISSAPECRGLISRSLSEHNVMDRCVDLVACSRNVRDRASDVITLAVARGVFVDDAMIETRLNDLLDASGMCADAHVLVGVVASVGHGLSRRSDPSNDYLCILLGPAEKMFRAAARRWIDAARSDPGESISECATQVIKFMEVWRAWFCKGSSEALSRVAEDWIRSILRPMLDVLVQKHKMLSGVAQLRRAMLSELKRLGCVGIAAPALQEQIEVLVSLARLPWPDVHNHILVIDTIPSLIPSDPTGARKNGLLGVISSGLETFTSSELCEAVVGMVASIFKLPGIECYKTAAGDSEVVLPRVWDLMDDGNAIVRQAVMDCMIAVTESRAPRDVLERSLLRSKFLRKRKRDTGESGDIVGTKLFYAVCGILRTEGEALVRRAAAKLFSRLVLSPVYEDEVQSLLNDTDKCSEVSVAMHNLANDFDWEIKVVALELLIDIQKLTLARPEVGCTRSRVLDGFFSSVQGPKLLRDMLNDVDRVPRRSVAVALLQLKTESSAATNGTSTKAFLDSLSADTLRRREGDSLPESVYGDEFTLSEELLAGNIHAALDCY